MPLNIQLKPDKEVAVGPSRRGKAEVLQGVVSVPPGEFNCEFPRDREVHESRIW